MMFLMLEIEHNPLPLRHWNISYGVKIKQKLDMLIRFQIIKRNDKRFSEGTIIKDLKITRKQP